MSFDLDTAKSQVRTFIEKYPPINEHLVKASEQTKIDKEFIFLGALGVTFLFVFLVTGGDIIIDMIGFIYPFYMSMKAIESDDPEDDKQWLTYWIVFVLFKIVENVADFLVSFIPFYFFFKVGFLVWCSHPSFKGAALVYDLLFKAYVVPALGINVKPLPSLKAAATKKAVSHLEVSIDKVVLTTEVTEEKGEGEGESSEKQRGEGIFVEVAARPPPRVTRTGGDSGLEGTFFKTQVAPCAAVIDFQHQMDISPLPKSDGFLQVLIKEKFTYGDDVVLGERRDLQVSSFVKEMTTMVVTVGSYDVTLTAKYVSV